MQLLQASPVRAQPQRKTRISKDLATSTHAFVHHDAVHKLLQPPYNNPYHVLKRAYKDYTLDVANRQEVVLQDHLKPAFMDCDLVSDVDELAPATTTAQPSSIPRTVTCFGRQVSRPVHFSLPFAAVNGGGECCSGTCMRHHVPTESDEMEVIISGTVLNQYNHRILNSRTEILKILV